MHVTILDTLLWYLGYPKSRKVMHDIVTVKTWEMDNKGSESGQNVHLRGT